MAQHEGCEEETMKVLVAEDEAIIRNGILSHLKWRQLDIEEVRSADSGTAALALFHEFHPDIIITDIQMPGLSGVEFCRQVRAVTQEVQFIFLTGYVNTEYLMAAIDLQAISYLEKPLRVEKLHEALLKAIASINNSRIRKEAELHRMLLSNHHGIDVLSNSRIILIHLEQQADVEPLVQYLSGVSESSFAISMIDPVSSRTLALLASCGVNRQTGKSEPDDKLWEDTFSTLLTRFSSAPATADLGGWFCAIGTPIAAASGTADSYQQAVAVLQNLAWMGWNHCTDTGCSAAFNNDREAQRHFLEQLRILIGKDSHVEAEKLIRDYFDELIEAHTILDYPLYTFSEEILREITRGTSPAELPQITDLETIVQIRDTAIHLLRTLKAGGSAESSGKLAVQRVMAYIREHYSDPELSVRTLAEEVYLTPTYLSTLFHNETGSTIGQIITEVRMEMAKQMLRDPQYKLYEIASLVGYNDANYFAKTFKKKTGVSPSEYRGL
ncbi:MAG: response regulator [Lachnospiraceae bacterium]|nr:response regulator [Lachnospiraceae bacterium]